MTDRVFTREESLMQIPLAAGPLQVATTTIEFHGYEISINMNNNSKGDLTHTTIKVFKGEEDVTLEFSSCDGVSSHDLFSIMHAIYRQDLDE